MNILVRARDEASSVMRRVGSSTSSVGSKFASLGRSTVAAARVGAVGLTALGGAAAYAFGQFQESRKIAAQTNAVLKSTKGSAGIAADGISSMATRLSMLSGVDDEVVQSGENMLLTFTNIKDKVGGEFVGTFDRATQTMLDMSVALGQDTKSSAIQLGKALNDPIKGITALQRVGVAFTEQQKAQIETLVKHGKTVEAQTLILDELDKEFGGSAEAQATWQDKLKVAVGNVAESFGKLLAPAVDFVSEKLTGWAQWLSTNLIPTVKRVGDALMHLPSIFQHLSSSAKGLIVVVGALLTVLFPGFAIIAAIAGAAVLVYKNWSKIAPVLQKVWSAAKPVVELFAGALWNSIKKVWTIIQTQLWPSIVQLWKSIAPLIKILGILVGVQLMALIKALPIVVKVIAVAISIIAKLASGISSLVGWVIKAVAWIGTRLVGAFQAVANLGGKIWDGLFKGAKAAINAVIVLWNGIDFGFHFTIPDVPGLPGRGQTIGVDDLFPDIPLLAQGGVVSRPTLAILGEAGPEAVVPLSRFNENRTYTIRVDRRKVTDGTAYDARYGRGWR